MGKYENRPEPNRSKKSSNTSKKKKKSPVLAIVAILLLCLMAALAIWILTPPSVDDTPGQNANNNPTNTNGKDPNVDAPETKDENARKPGVYTVLLVGTMDEYNTDSLMLASVDSNTDIVNVVSIPRDTMVDIQAKNKKINGAYGRDGIDELCREVGDISGVYPDYYAVVNVENFIKIVDLFGGVDFEVPYNMNHVDSDAKFTINLNKGMQLLDGKKALQMVRYRGTSASDFGRMELQREFLVAVAKKALSSFNVTQIKDMIPIINESLETNMPVRDMIWFYLNVISEINFDTSVTFLQAPVEATGRYNKLSYVYLDKTAFLEMINTSISPYTLPLTEDKLNIIRKEN